MLFQVINYYLFDFKKKKYKYMNNFEKNIFNEIMG